MMGDCRGVRSRTHFPLHLLHDVNGASYFQVDFKWKAGVT